MMEQELPLDEGLPEGVEVLSRSDPAPMMDPVPVPEEDADADG
jgi:hypothetical protein